jgi:hypothetical protein
MPSEPSRDAVIAALAAALAISAGSASGARLDDLRDHKRVVVVFAARADDSRLAEQRRALDPLVHAADDRDLKLVEVVAGRVEGVDDSAPVLARRLNRPPAAFRVCLIGKDGGLKLSRTRPISAADLAATIDAMPMRREEMRR